MLENYAIKTHTGDYSTTKVRAVRLSPQRKKQRGDPVVEQVRADLRSATMVLMWVSREGWVDIQGGVSLICHKIHEATVGTLIELNAIVAHLNETKHLGELFIPVHPRKAVFAVTADCAPNAKGDIFSQAGLVLGITTPALETGLEAPFNIVSARSGKAVRVCASFLAVEVFALVGGVACAEWTQMTYCELRNALFDPALLRLRVLGWDRTTPEQPHHLLVKLRGALMIKDDANSNLSPGLAINNAKSLYDVLRKEVRGK